MSVLHLAQLKNDVESAILAIGASNSAVQGQWYYANDTDLYRYGKTDGSLSAAIPFEYITGQADTDSISLSVDAATRELTANLRLDGASDNILQVNSAGAYVKDVTIAPTSSNYLEYDPVTRQISMKAVSVVEITVDSTSTDLAGALTANYSAGTEMQEGDVLHIPLANEVYVHNGGSAGDATDFTRIEKPDLEDSYIRNLFGSTTEAITYNPTDGNVTFNISTQTGNDITLVTGADKGIFLDVSAASVTDTNDVLGGGAVDVTVQALFDAVTEGLVTAENGLTDQPNGVIELGGALTKNTTITVGAHTLAFAGTTTMTAEMDLEFLTASSGFILKSANGTRYKLTVTDYGALEATELV